MAKKRIALYLLRALLIALCVCSAGFIFYNSIQTGEESSSQSKEAVEIVQEVVGAVAPESPIATATGEDFDRLHITVRTLAHFSEYAALGFLSALLFLTYDIKRSLSLLYAVAFSAFYAMTDEIHQIFVPGRAAQISDFLVDTSGALFGSIMLLIAAAVAAFCAKQMKKPRKPKNTKTKKKITKKIF